MSQREKEKDPDDSLEIDRMIDEGSPPVEVKPVRLRKKNDLLMSDDDLAKIRMDGEGGRASG